MDLIPWSGGGLTTLQNRINRLFQDFFTPEGPLAVGNGGGPAVCLDVAETPEAVIVRTEIPGIDPAKIDVALSGDYLTISGEKSAEKEEKGKTWHRVERSYGKFTRSILLPVPVEEGKIEARAKDGVLTITLPKVPSAQPKKIAVKNG